MSVVAGAIQWMLDQPTITDVVGTRIYSQVAPQNAILPHILVTRLDENHNLTMDGTGGLVFADIDIDSVSSNPKIASDLATVIKELIKDFLGDMGGVTVAAVLLNGISDGHERPEHGGGQGRYIVALSLMIQYRE